MQEKITLAFVVATFVAAIGLLVAHRGVSQRVAGIEREMVRGGGPGAEPRGADPVRNRSTPPSARPERVPGEPVREAHRDPAEMKTIAERLDWIVDKLREMEENDYETYVDLQQDLVALKREVGKLSHLQKKIARAMTEGGSMRPHLPPAGQPLSDEDARRFRDEAATLGIQVEEGLVTVRGFLNLAPNTNMPIEFFMTRFPESGHETLIHLVGNKSPEELRSDYIRALSGLSAGLYKALLAAGFQEGKPAHPDPESPMNDPRWILATGDTVYIYMRYELEGETHVARATDWVMDPSTGTVLPQDCFRFTGSSRIEDIDTGEEILGAEATGLLVSVWPNRHAMVEVALRSAFSNNYRYNFKRIPAVKELLYVDVIFSKEPMDVTVDATGDQLPDPEDEAAEARGDGEDEAGDGD